MAAESNGGVRPPRLLDRVRAANRLRHGSRSTEKSYVGWIRRFILLHGKRHPAQMGAPEVAQFLSSLAVEGKVAASTQNQALSALLFLYRYVLQQDLPWLDDIVLARRPKHLGSVTSCTCPLRQSGIGSQRRRPSGVSSARVTRVRFEVLRSDVQHARTVFRPVGRRRPCTR
jgi:hypothetical protein